MKRGPVTVAILAALLAGCYLVATPDGMEVGIAPVVTPRLTYIAGTPIQVVSAAGVGGDVFYYGNAYWRWHGGRWWRSTAWNRGWIVVTSVPQAFLSIPLGHRLHRVVQHHPLYKRPTAKSRTSIRAPVTRTVRPQAVGPKIVRPKAVKKPAHKTVVVPARPKPEEKKEKKKKEHGGSAKSKGKGRVIIH